MADVDVDATHDEQGPLRGYLGGTRLALIWLAANLVVTTQLTGTLFVPGVSWLHALLLIAAGTLIGALPLVLIGNMGTRTGLPTMALSRGAFGIRGSLIPVTANVMVLMGWSWVQAMLGGIALNIILQQLTGLSSPAACAVACQLLVVCLALFGHASISRVEPWLAAIMLALIVYLFSVSFSSFSVGEFLAIPENPELGWSPVLIFDVVVATAISWTVLSADINRLAASQQAGVTGCFLGYFASTLLSMSFGATAIGFVILSGATAEAFDPGTVINAYGMPLAIVIVLSVIATNTMVLYGMVSTTANAARGSLTHFLPIALVLGAISVVGATFFALLDQFTAFLSAIGTLFIPVFAIMISDYYLLNRGCYGPDLIRRRGGIFWFRGGFGLTAVITWCAAATVSLVLTYAVQSPIGATLPTFLFAFALYSILGIATGKRKAEQLAQRHFSQMVEITT